MSEITAFTPAPAGGQQPLAVGFYGTSPNDPIGWLGPIARERLKMLRQRISDLRSLCVPFDDLRSASEAKLECDRILNRLVARASEAGFDLKLSDPRVIHQQAMLDTATAEHERLAELDRVSCATAGPAIQGWRMSTPPTKYNYSRERPW